MRQQVNLYQPILRREKKVFSARALAISLGMVVAGLIVITGAVMWIQSGKEAEVERLAERKQSAEARLTQMEAQFRPPQKDPALERRVQQLRREVEAKREFLANFSAQALGYSDGFAESLVGLSRQVFEGVWLESFTLYGAGRINLEGGALRPAQVPRLIDRLGDEPVFSGRAFRELELSRPEDNRSRVRFRLISVQDGERAEGGGG